MNATTDGEVELTILMPCLNEAETIAKCIQKAKSFLERSGVTGEVLVADNGSTDGSPDISVELGARVVPVHVRGYGAALLGGLKAARGKYVIMGDADDSYDFSSLAAFVERLRSGADIVIGNRFSGGIETGAMPFLHRYVGNPVLSWLGRLFFNIKVRDFHCGLRGVSRERILSLGFHTTGMEFASEMIVLSALSDYKIEEVPTTLAVDGRSRAPHLRTWRDGWRHLSFLLMYSPRWLFLYPGFALIVIGLLAGLVLFPGKLVVGGVGFDIHTFVVASFMLLVGTQAISFALLARRFGAANGLMKPSRYSAALNVLSLEVLLLAAIVLFLGGVAGLVGCAVLWASSGFGPLEYSSMLRVLVFSMTAIALGGQLALNAFLASIVDIPRR